MYTISEDGGKYFYTISGDGGKLFATLSLSSFVCFFNNQVLCIKNKSKHYFPTADQWEKMLLFNRKLGW